MTSPSQYPLLGHAPPFDTKLSDPTGPLSECWSPDPGARLALSTPAFLSEAQIENSRKRFRAGARVGGTPDADLHVSAADSGDDMIITDCEVQGGGEHDINVHPPKRRMTASTGPEGQVEANTRSIPATTATINVPVAPSSCPITSTHVEHVHPCTPTLVESPTSPHSPVSELDESNPHQLVLPSPSASPVQSAAGSIDHENLENQANSQENKPLAQMAIERQLSAGVPVSQSELISMIVGLSGFVSPRNKNNLVFQLLQRLPRQSLSSFCDMIQKSLCHDLLSALPLELALTVLSCLDVRSLLSVSQVSRRWHTLVSNTKLWCFLLKRDGLLINEQAVQHELADPAKLYAEWATPSPYVTEINYAQLLYKKRYLIFKRWMDPTYEPRRISVAGHGSNIVTCLQHDDEKVITGIEGKQINVHSTKTGRLSRLLQGHDGGVWALKYFSNTLVSGSTDRDVRVWNIRTGRCTHVFRGHTSTVRCLDILHPVQIGVDENGQPIVFPEHPLLVTGSRDHNLHVWKLPLDNERVGGDEITETKTFDSKDPNNPYLVSILSGHTQSVRSVSGYGNIIISGSYDATVRVWDLLKGGRCKHVLEGHTDKIYSTALNFNARRCFSGSMDSSINVWDFEKGKLLYSLEGHNLLVGLLELSDKYLVSAAADSTLRVWDPKTGENLSKLKGHNSAITCFQHDGLRIVSGSERMLKLWDIQTGKFVRDLLSDITGSIWQVSFDADRCVAAVQTSKNGAEETFIEILDFSTPLNEISDAS